MTELPPQGFRHALTLLVTNARRRLKASGSGFCDETAFALADEIVALADDMKAPAGVVDWIAEEFQRLTGSSIDVRPTLKRIGRTSRKDETCDLFLVYVPEDRLPSAGPLAIELVKRGISVAFSEFEVSSRDELEIAILRGLARHRAGVLIESRQFHLKHWNASPLDPRLLVLDDVDHAPTIANHVIRWLSDVHPAGTV